MTNTLDIQRAWCLSTSSIPNEWSRSNEARGQCAVTALVVQDLYGGDLMRCLVNGESHYFNRLPDGTDLDLTIRQFSTPITRTPAEVRTREYVLSYPDTVARYQLLKERLTA